MEALDWMSNGISIKKMQLLANQAEHVSYYNNALHGQYNI
jgi:hypothetical protein